MLVTALRDDPQIWRSVIRTGGHVGPTAGLAAGWAQANLISIPRIYGRDFLLFCQRNPGPCPLLEVTAPGSREAKHLAPGSDLRTDLPRYRVFIDGVLFDEVTDVVGYWEDDLVSFLIGCSFTFDHALRRNGIPVRHLEENLNVPMYVTNRLCEPAGPFSAPLVVSMRPIPRGLVHRTIQVTSRYAGCHGAPVHIGEPALLGISDLAAPDFGDAVSIDDREVPVFWACGVTSEVAACNAHLPFCITHSPGHMLITDWTDDQIASF